MSGPTPTTNLIESDASDPTLSTTSKPGRLGHLDLVGKGLVAMYPKSPSSEVSEKEGSRSQEDGVEYQVVGGGVDR